MSDNKEILGGIELTEQEQNILDYMNADINESFNSLENAENTIIESVLNEGVADEYLVEGVKDKAKEILKKLKEFFKKVIDFIKQKIRGHKMDIMTAKYEKKDGDGYLTISTVSGKVVKKIKEESDKDYYVTIYHGLDKALDDFRKAVKKGSSKSNEVNNSTMVSNAENIGVIYKIKSLGEVSEINFQLKEYSKAVSSIYEVSNFSLKELSKEKDSNNRRAMKTFNQIRKLIQSTLNFKNVIKIYDKGSKPSNVSSTNKITIKLSSATED